MYEQNENVNKEKNLRIKILELKSTITEMKHSLEELKGRYKGRRKNLHT